MNRHKYIMILIIWIIFGGFTACTNHTSHTSLPDKIISNTPSSVSKQASPSNTDSLTMPKQELTKIYTQAIAEFIKAANYKDKSTFDTLYFGKHVYGQPDDFPDIVLPQTIEGTQIRLVSPEVGQEKQIARKSLVYVNMMGWTDKDNAEFIFVVFTNGGEHQYDYFINFNYNAASANFELNKIEYEDYLHLNKQKPERTTIYIDGKYVGNK